MTDETIDCFNCGRANPEWAQVCRSCGVALRHGVEPVAPGTRFPTDRDSLVSIGAVIGTILLAVLLGYFLSNLGRDDSPSVAADPSPSVEPRPSRTAAPTEEPPAPTVTASPSPTPVPLPGTLTFGTALADNLEISEPADTFTPGMNFGYSVTMPDGFGAEAIQNEVVRIQEGERPVVLPKEAVGVAPDATTFGYVLGPADTFIDAWGAGQYEWRVFIGDELVARGRFRLAEG